MTANVAGFYGDDSKHNRFPGPKGEMYFTLVNKKTGEIELWNEEFGIDRRVGALDPATKNWNFTETASGKSTTARDFEVEYFSKPQNKAGVINQALTTVERDQQTGSNLEEGEQRLGNSTNAVAESQKNARELLSTNQQSSGVIEGQQKITGEALQKSLKDGVKASAGTRQNFGTMVYPLALRDQMQDVIKFSMLEYAPRKYKNITQDNMSGFEQGRRGGKSLSERKILGSVTLPIPGGIADTNAVDWGEDTQNPLQAAVANLALEAIINNKVDMSNVGETIKENKESLKAALGTAIVSSATGVQFDAMIGRQAGAILNPIMELLFKKPTLRPFAFNFKLSPRSRKEAQSVVKIIRFFKQGMAPQRTEGKLFLKTPNTFKINYLHRGRDHQYLNRFKECALQNLTVDYTPDGNYATYEDGVMTQYVMTMQFKELEAVFNDDYEFNDDLSANVPFGQGTGPILPGQSNEVPAQIGY